MSSLRCREILFFALLIVGVIVIATVTSQSTWLQYIEMSAALREHAANPLNVIDPLKVAHNSTETHCVTAKVANNTFPVCTYSAEDDPVVSADMQRGAYFEQRFVTYIVKLLHRHSTVNSKADFVDIGANVGAYSLTAAHSGHRVIALEPNMKTMRHLAASVVSGNIQERIVLLNNAATNVSGSTLHVVTFGKNRGDTRVLSEESCEQVDPMVKCHYNGHVPTITLNDLLLLRPERSETLVEKWRLIMKLNLSKEDGEEKLIAQLAHSHKATRHATSPVTPTTELLCVEVNNIDRFVSNVLETASDDVNVLRELLYCREGTFNLSNSSFSHYDVEKLIIPVDAQGSEVDIFNPSACSRFLDEVDVMAIQMEWIMIQWKFANDSEAALMVNKMLKNLYDHNYVVYDVGGNMIQLLEKDWRRWPSDIMFKKNVYGASKL